MKNLVQKYVMSFSTKMLNPNSLVLLEFIGTGSRGSQLDRIILNPNNISYIALRIVKVNEARHCLNEGLTNPE